MLPHRILRNMCSEMHSVALLGIREDKNLKRNKFLRPFANLSLIICHLVAKSHAPGSNTPLRLLRSCSTENWPWNPAIVGGCCARSQFEYCHQVTLPYQLCSNNIRDINQ